MHLICCSVHFLEHSGGMQIFIQIFINAEVACRRRQHDAVSGRALNPQPSNCIMLRCNALAIQRLKQCMQLTCGSSMQRLRAKVLTVRGDIRREL